MAQATTVTPLDHLVKVLKLGEPSAYRNHTYINGESMYFPTGRVYGGQVIAQSVIAASKTVGPSRLPHSVHGYFIAAGDIRQDLLFDVENLRDGRSFSARRVNVTQAEGSILTAIASFQETGQEGVEFADPMPENLPDPETLTSAKELMQPFAEKSPFANYYAEKSPFDIRHVTPTVILRADKVVIDDWETDKHRMGDTMAYMFRDGKIDDSRIDASVSDLVAGRKFGRDNDDQLTYTCNVGLGLYDVAIAARVYRYAKENGIGQKLKLWDEPIMV